MKVAGDSGLFGASHDAISRDRDHRCVPAPNPQLVSGQGRANRPDLLCEAEQRQEGVRNLRLDETGEVLSLFG
jgi:hypothetical protein